jgi:hypothetical protein
LSGRGREDECDEKRNNAAAEKTQFHRFTKIKSRRGVCSGGLSRWLPSENTKLKRPSPINSPKALRAERES